MTEPGRDAGGPPVVAVSNRLPVTPSEDGWELSPGGLVTALRPVMATHSGVWVGWDGGIRGMPAELPELGVRLQPIGLSPAQVRRYYHGFANSTVWPLLHDAIEKPVFDRAWWQGYQDVNRSFATATARAIEETPGALCWIHDYHLMLVPRLVRERVPDQRIGFFLHVPWPSPDIFARLPWRQDILLGLLGADVVSFHTDGYRENFLRACAHLLGGTGVRVEGSSITLPDHRVVSAMTAPISIDVDEFTALAADPATERDIKEIGQQFADRTLLIGMDRLDYTKGIIERVLAIEMLLERSPELRSKVAFLQVAVPSRDDVAEYRRLRSSLEGHIGRINGQFTEPGSEVPVHYLYRSLSQHQVAAYYAVAECLLVTPLIDGMNLVAKEYVTVQHALGGSGSMVLSEFTGAAAELPEAVPCNPFDVEGLSYRIEQALRLPDADRRAALAAMAGRVRAHDVHRWVAGQIASIEGRSAAT
jgi:trehalose 6-phosphate synthase